MRLNTVEMMAQKTAEQVIGSDIGQEFIRIVNFFAAGVGVIVLAMIVVGGIQYASAGDNAQNAAAARNRIKNAIIGLILYLFMFAIVNFLVPGGILS